MDVIAVLVALPLMAVGLGMLFAYRRTRKVMMRIGDALSMLLWPW